MNQQSRDSVNYKNHFSPKLLVVTWQHQMQLEYLQKPSWVPMMHLLLCEDCASCNSQQEVMSEHDK